MPSAGGSALTVVNPAFEARNLREADQALVPLSSQISPLPAGTATTAKIDLFLVAC